MPDLNPFNPDLREVRAVEVMRVGTWNDIEFTVADLDEMVHAFAKGLFSVPLKIGHGESSGMPAYGWVHRVYRQGQVLMADFRDVPEWIFDLVFKQHQYDSVSIEVLFNLKCGENTYKRVLKAVALLGAETPAVSGLQPLRDAIFAPAADQYEKQIAFSSKVATPMPTPTTPTNPQQVVTPAGDQPTQAQFAALQASNAELAAKLAKRDEDTNALLATVATLSQQQAAASVNAKVAAIGVPAVREHFRHLYALAGVGAATPKVVKFKAEDGKETDKPLEEVLDELVAQYAKLTKGLTAPSFGSRQANGGAQPMTSAASDRPDEELAEAVQTHMEANSLANNVANYQKATKAVLAANKDLADRYKAFARGQASN